jgi:uncharacterized protein
MKIIGTLFLSVLLMSTSVCAALVQDNAHIIKVTDRQKMAQWIEELEDKTSAQVAVVTVATLGQVPLEEYAATLFAKWGIGQKKKDNGILLLVAPNERVLRIEVGYGLEAVVTDAISGQIINSVIIPEFKEGRYSEGILKGVWNIISVVAKDREITVTEPLIEGKKNFDPVGLAIIFFIFLCFWLQGRFGARRKGPFFSGGGFRGGGGGSFGGGSSGGGGASGRW